MSLTATKQWACDEREPRIKFRPGKFGDLRMIFLFHGNVWRLRSELDYCVVRGDPSWCTDSKIDVAIIKSNKTYFWGFLIQIRFEVSPKGQKSTLRQVPVFLTARCCHSSWPLVCREKQTVGKLFFTRITNFPSFTTRTSDRPHNCGDSIGISFWLPEGERRITESTTKAQWSTESTSQLDNLNK